MSRSAVFESPHVRPLSQAEFELQRTDAEILRLQAVVAEQSNALAVQQHLLMFLLWVLTVEE